MTAALPLDELVELLSIRSVSADPARRDGRVRTTDDKGQFYVLLRAAADLARTGEPSTPTTTVDATDVELRRHWSERASVDTCG